MSFYTKREKLKGRTDDINEMKTFLNPFMDTQMYQMFIEDRVWPSERNFEVLLFDAYIEKLEHSKNMSSFLDDTSQEVITTTRIEMSDQVMREWRRSVTEGEAAAAKEEKKSGEKKTTTYSYGGMFPSKLDLNMMESMTSTCHHLTAGTNGSSNSEEERTRARAMMSRHQRRTLSSAVSVMESVYLQFYTKRKMFSTRHAFSLRAAQDALDQTEIIRSALESVQKVDETFLINLRSCRKKYEESTFKWSTMDPSNLMKGTYWYVTLDLFLLLFFFFFVVYRYWSSAGTTYAVVCMY